MARPAISEHDIELSLASLLRAGVLAAAALVLAGGVIYLGRYGGTRPHPETFAGEPEDLKTFGGIVNAALALRGRGLIQLGLVVLIATPVARVAFSLYAFARQRDRAYVLITAFVLTLLLASLFQVWRLVGL
jgi:uncharacterized membrane protein